VHVRPFIERCPHSAPGDAAGAAELAAGSVADRTAGLAGVELVVDPADLSAYRASRIARIAASLLIVHSLHEL
jgi:hypothetical protein